MLRPHQAARHFSALFRRQLQRHTEEIQEHGGAGLRLPLTRAKSGGASVKVGCTLTSGRHRIPAQIFNMQRNVQPERSYPCSISIIVKPANISSSKWPFPTTWGSSIGNFTLFQSWATKLSTTLPVSCGLGSSLHGSATEWMTVCVCVCGGEAFKHLSLYIMCLLKCVYECLRGYCTFSLPERVKLNCRGTSQSAAFFPVFSPT